MDKSWITVRNRLQPEYMNRLQPEYMNGIKRFLDFAYINRRPGDKIKCPCIICQNSKAWRRKPVYEHVVMYGFLDTYTNWVHHGEIPVVSHYEEVDDICDNEDDFDGMIREGFGLWEKTMISQTVSLMRESKTFSKY